MQKLKTRTTTFICNLLVCVLSLASIGSYFLLPLWKVEASYHIQASTIEEMLEEMLEENAESSDESADEAIDLSSIDVKELVPDEGLTISFSLGLETKDVLASLGKNASQSAQNLIDTTLNKTVDQFSDLLSDIAKQATKAITKTVIQSTVKDQISSVLQDEMEEIEQIMSNAGIDDTYITEKTDELVESIFNDNITVNDVTENVTAIVEEVFDKLANSGNEEFKDLALSTEDKELIANTVSDALAFIANEDGTIDVDALITEGLLSILNGESFDIPEEIPEGGIDGMRATYMEADSDSTDVSLDNSAENDEDNLTDEEKDTQAELKAMLLEKISEALPENTAQILANIFKVISYILLFTFFTWLYLIIKILFKLNKLNNSIKMGLPLWLGWWPFLVLYAIPKSIFSSITNPPAYLTKLMDAETKQALSEFSASFNISFTTGAWVSFAVAVFLILFNLFFYRKLRKTLKSIENGEISQAEEETQSKPDAKNSNVEEAPIANENEAEETIIEETNNTREETPEVSEKNPIAEAEETAEIAVTDTEEVIADEEPEAIVSDADDKTKSEAE